MRIPCGRTLGHGEACCDGNLCDQCRTINGLVAACERLLADYLALWDGITDEPKDRSQDETVRMARDALSRAKE